MHHHLMWGMGWGHAIGLFVLALIVIALIKYLFSN